MGSENSLSTTGKMGWETAPPGGKWNLTQQGLSTAAFAVNCSPSDLRDVLGGQVLMHYLPLENEMSF